MIEQWANRVLDAGNPDTDKRKVTFYVNFTSANSYTTNVDAFVIKDIAGIGDVPKTNNTVTWVWDTRNVIMGGIIAIGY